MNSEMSSVVLTVPPDSEPLPHILVVDDEPEIRTMVALCLKKGNLSITCAANAAEAFTLLVAEPFDAIVSDVMMPGEDGISFLGRVHDSWPELPVILMTGHAQLQMAVNAIKNGAFDFVHKPFDFDHLRKIVMRAVNFRNLQRIEKNYRIELEETVTRRTVELRASMAELDFARKALQQAATDKSTFMSTISHEMRTPMNGVIGALELLDDEGLSGTAREYLVMARQSADSMMALINQLLSFNALSGLQVGVMPKDLVAPGAFISALAEGLRPLFIRKGIALTVSLAENLPQQMWTDKEKITRLFEILLGNALKFTVQGVVVCDVVRTGSPGDDDRLVCTITDSGVGIPESMLERIFEPFVQGDGSFSRSYEGVGLGLAIARQNAAFLNGQLWAEHVSSGGSRFVVSLKISTP